MNDSPPRNLRELQKQAKGDGPMLASSGIPRQASAFADQVRAAVADGGHVIIDDDVPVMIQYSLVLVERGGVMVRCFVMRETQLDRLLLVNGLASGDRALAMFQVGAPSEQIAAPRLLHALLCATNVTAEDFWSYVASIPRVMFAAAHHLGLRATKKMFNRPMTRVSSEGTWAA